MRKYAWKRRWTQVKLVHWRATLGTAWFCNALAFVICDFMHWRYIHSSAELWVTAFGFAAGGLLYWGDAKKRLPDDVIPVRVWFS